VAFVKKGGAYPSVVGWVSCHTKLKVCVVLMFEDPIVTVYKDA